MKMWLTELARMVLVLFVMYGMVLLLFLYYSFSSLPLGEGGEGLREDQSSRGWHGHRLTEQAKQQNREYLDANILTVR